MNLLTLNEAERQLYRRALDMHDATGGIECDCPSEHHSVAVADQATAALLDGLATHLGLDHLSPYDALRVFGVLNLMLCTTEGLVDDDTDDIDHAQTLTDIVFSFVYALIGRIASDPVTVELESVA